MRIHTQRRRGSSMVEFAMVFILFMTMAVGLMEGGRMVWVYTTLSHAARQGARYAVVHGVNSPVPDSNIAAVVHANSIGLAPKDVIVKTAWEAGKGKGSIVEVDVAYDLPFMTANLFVKSKQIRLASTARMIVLN